MKARFFKNYVRIWDPNTSLCCTTALRDCFLVVMYYLVRLNCDKKFIFFLKRRNTNITEHFVNEDFLVKLAYLCDIFEKLNPLNLSLQSMEKIVAFIKS
jgi:hypothetical protein